MELRFSPREVAELGFAHDVRVDPFTGAASIWMPIPVTPGRNGFGPSITLVHRVGAPNSPFGAGIALVGLPAVAVDSARGVPRYDESDVVTFDGAELAPERRQVGSNWIPRARTVAGHDIHVHRRRRGGAGVRVERWTDHATGRVHWRSRDAADTLTIFGDRADGSSRIADPDDASRVAMWLPERIVAPRGDVIEIEYVAEDAAGVDYSQSYERARLGRGLAQRYLKRIRWGNSAPADAAGGLPPGARFCFELVLDYGDHADTVRPGIDPDQPWLVRPDPYSTFRLGFEVRTYRLCRRLLQFHHFDELGAGATLVGITTLEHDDKTAVSRLRRVGYTGVRRRADDTIETKSIPALELEYAAESVAPAFLPAPRETEENAPAGLAASWHEFVDLFGEGLPGVLIQGESAWHYKPNLGDGRFGALTVVAERPAARRGTFALGDPDADGDTDFVSFASRQAGKWELDRGAQRWTPFKPFEALPHLEALRGHALWVDLDGDGRADLVLAADDRLVWFPSREERGYGEPIEIALPGGARGPAGITDDALHEIFFADLDGDGLADLVRVQNGRVEYWPQLGHGRFGAGIVVDMPSEIAPGGDYDPRRVRFANLRGGGTPDLLYLAKGEIRVFRNHGGNRLVEAAPIRGLPFIDNVASVGVLDFLGDGRPCLVWSSGLPGTASAIHYLPLAEARRPSVVARVTNGLGSEVRLEHRSSSLDYLRDRARGEPWTTRLPSHVPVVAEKRVRDLIGGSETITRYTYHDGFFDSREGTFRGFGCVDTLEGPPDVDGDEASAQPRLTRTWFHLGAAPWRGAARPGYASDLPRVVPHEVEAPGALDPEDHEDALVSLAGQPTRREVFAASVDGRPASVPLRIEEWSYRVRLRQPAAGEPRTAIWSNHEHEELVHVLEGRAADPRSQRTVTLAVDPYDTVTRAMEIAYARRDGVVLDAPAQGRTRIIVSEQTVAHVDEADRYAIGVPIATRRLEVGGVSPENVEQALVAPLAHDADPPPSGAWARLLERDRFFYWNDAADAALPLGQVGRGALEHHREEACFTQSFAAAALGAVSPVELAAAGYVQDGGLFWLVEPTQARGPFGLLTAIERSDGATFRQTWDPWWLTPVSVEDPLGNVVTSAIDYHRVAPWRIRDANHAVEEIAHDPLGVAIRMTAYGQIWNAGEPAAYGHAPLAGETEPSSTDVSQVIQDADQILGGSGGVIVYDLHAFVRDGTPPVVVALTRERFAHEAAPAAEITVTYLDGFGRALQEKRRVEPGPAIQRTTAGGVTLDANGDPVLAIAAERWRAAGHVVYDSDHQPARQFEPFHTPTWRYEGDPVLQRHGVSTMQLRDALGRLVQVHAPDGTFSRTVYEAWSTIEYDANDLVDESLYAVSRAGLAATHPERRALEHSRTHAATPVTSFVDPSGAEVARLERGGATAEDRRVETDRDALGREVEVRDARGLVAFRWRLDMLGRAWRTESRDAGTTRTFEDAFGRTRSVWDGRGVRQDFSYDGLDRVISIHASGAALDHRVEERVYGESLPPAEARLRGLRGRVVTVRDDAGVVDVDQVDPIHGVVLRSRRRLRADTASPPDWRAATALDVETFTTEQSVDALGRTVRERCPDGVERRVTYLRGGAASRVIVKGEGATIAETTVLDGASYDAHGRLTSLRLGNGVEAAREYDRSSLRLAAAAVRRGPRTLQDLRYTYDASGFTVAIADRAQEPGAPSPILVGLGVSATREFAYDAHGRLRRATGRVHQSLVAGDAFSPLGTRHLHPNNGAAVERYTQTYRYDRSGNLDQIRHVGPTVNFTTDVWISPTSNRGLPAADLPANPESWFDAAGHTLRLPHLRGLAWTWSGRIGRSVIIDRGGADPDDAERYVYGSDGLRVLRVTERLVAGGIEVTEKLYLGRAERVRVRRGGSVVLERWTSRVSAGDDELATIHREGNDVRVVYSIGDSQGSPLLELDANGEPITYEEHFPYGGSAFIAAGDASAADRKQHRYMGKERDAATGLYDYGHRCYAPWIGRWISPDPIGPEDDLNLYRFVMGDPIGRVDRDGLETRPKGTGRLTGSHVAPPPIPPPNTPIPAGQRRGWNPATAAWEDRTTEDWQKVAKEQGFDIGVIDQSAAAAELAPLMRSIEGLRMPSEKDIEPSAWGRGPGDPELAARMYGGGLPEAPGAPSRPTAPGSGTPGAGGPGAGGPATGGLGATGTRTGGGGTAGARPGAGTTPGSGVGSGVGTGVGEAAGPRGARGASPIPGSGKGAGVGQGPGESAGLGKQGKGSPKGTGKKGEGGTGRRGQGGPGGSETGVPDGTGTNGGGTDSRLGGLGPGAGTALVAPQNPYGDPAGRPDGDIYGGMHGSPLGSRFPTDPQGVDPRGLPGKKGEEVPIGDRIARELAALSGIVNMEFDRDESKSHKYGIPGGGNANGIRHPAAQASFAVLGIAAALFGGGRASAAKKGVKPLSSLGRKLFRNAAGLLEKSPFMKQALRRIGQGLPLTGLNKEVLRQHARLAWQARHGLRLPSWIQVHHRIPLQYSHLFPGWNPNRMSNLMAMTTSAHVRTHFLWGLASKPGGPLTGAPTAKGVWEAAKVIDGSLRSWGVRRFFF